MFLFQGSDEAGGGDPPATTDSGYGGWGIVATTFYSLFLLIVTRTVGRG